MTTCTKKAGKILDRTKHLKLGLVVLFLALGRTLETVFHTSPSEFDRVNLSFQVIPEIHLSNYFCSAQLLSTCI